MSDNELLHKEEERLRKAEDRKAKGQMHPGRVTAIVILGILALLLVLVAIENFSSITSLGIGCYSPKGPCNVIRAYAWTDLLLAAGAAFGAGLVYWSRPR